MTSETSFANRPVVAAGPTDQFAADLASRFKLSRLPDQIDPEAEVLVSQFAKVDRALLDRLPKLKAIVSTWAGFDNIDLNLVRERGLMLANAQGAFDICCADLSMGLLIAAVRRIGAADRHVRAGKWPTARFPMTRRVSGRRMGIYGMGGIGGEIAKRGLGFDMEIGYHNRRRQPAVPYRYFEDLKSLAEWADYLMIACPLTEVTRNSVNREVLTALGPEGCLVNIARGGIVDEPVMLEMLQSGALGSAGLDVFADEPNVPEGFFKLENAVIVPHIGGVTEDSHVDSRMGAIRNVETFFKTGKLATPVDLSKA